ncbi:MULTISPECIES: FAD binding domain-containing protein [Clostridium]|uniref:Nicotinate dehydrogenase FAD-subunit n=2 Tax=Clostridium TaxID=1485 RepID=A0A151AMU5_9CLOT|nr:MULTISPECIES: FAD binding domain-containing protein [Clostridium]KYH28922.1 nicotinate dehydrogenase FAD-subunit [Clostridium colicanis DSM 13634]MBE6044879.1 xanthine dehydrogenase family protein subunit M [Clostridium thermopalmarium]PRR73188.1 Nicotinate dehydrogenase FAD-subunit [Clostridium thermopalmarium DSM 5974]PVZ25247.1 CO/xanthine dehydrogenase FAD-binding subunit [Clostridium thermopalmarium DSM 5974]
MVGVYRPKTLKEALEIIDKEECIIFSGGTDLMVKNKKWSGVEPGFTNPVVFISDLKELKKIEKEHNTLRLGAACTCCEIAESSLVPDYFKEVFLNMASPAIRNIATVGGNICNASPAGDSLPLLYALEAKLILESVNGERKVPIQKFILGPGKNDIKENEILREIEIDIGDFNKFCYKKVGTRKSIALSKVSFMGLAKVDKGKIEDIRIAFGACGPKVIKDKTAESWIIKINSINNNELNYAKKIYSKLITPIDDQRSTADYRKNVCLRILEDFLITLNK